MNLFRVFIYIYIFVGRVQNNRNLTIDFGCIFSLRIRFNGKRYLLFKLRISTLIHFFFFLFFLSFQSFRKILISNFIASLIRSARARFEVKFNHAASTIQSWIVRVVRFRRSKRLEVISVGRRNQWGSVSMECRFRNVVGNSAQLLPSLLLASNLYLVD